MEVGFSSCFPIQKSHDMRGPKPHQNLTRRGVAHLNSFQNHFPISTALVQ